MQAYLVAVIKIISVKAFNGAMLSRKVLFLDRETVLKRRNRKRHAGAWDLMLRQTMPQNKKLVRTFTRLAPAAAIHNLHHSPFAGG